MPLVGAKAILLCSDDGNNVRAAQLWARTNEVRFKLARRCARAALFGDHLEGAAAGRFKGDAR